NFTPVLLN
ncbi:hypothetical protein VCPCS023_000571B, partial [Vibrio cholerae O1 str. PCS-023]